MRKQSRNKDGALPSQSHRKTRRLEVRKNWAQMISLLIELANAMLLSARTDNWVDIPVDQDLYY
jgi:hypothetical protein